LQTERDRLSGRTAIQQIFLKSLSYIKSQFVGDPLEGGNKVLRSPRLWRFLFYFQALLGFVVLIKPFSKLPSLRSREGLGVSTFYIIRDYLLTMFVGDPLEGGNKVLRSPRLWRFLFYFQVLVEASFTRTSNKTKIPPHLRGE
jgi:hypothetical protein